MVSPSKRKFLRGKPFVNKEESNFYKSKTLYKPLLNKRFYLDVKNYKGAQSLKIDLVHLGGIVEDFLVREVNYVITIRNLKPSSGGSSSEQHSPSTPFTPSPITPHPPSFLSASCDSPNIESPKEEAKKKARTRAEALFDRACFKRQGTSDVFENARLWGIPVWSLSKLLKWLAGLKLSPLYQPPRKTSPNRRNSASKRSSTTLVQSSKSQKLQAPFLKVEGFSREYRPHFKEFKSWPTLNLNCSEASGISPFADPNTTAQPEVKASSTHKDNYQERQKSRQTRALSKGGYCELCSANFSELKLHLLSSSHLSFVKDDSNYSDLDELISKYALNIPLC